MRLAIHGKEFNRQSAPVIIRLFEILTIRKIEFIVSTNFSRYLKSAAFKKFRFKTFEPGNALKGIDFFISIGGDGTLLECVTFIGSNEIPVLGINTGRLGFLATINKDDTEQAITHLLSGAFRLDKRAILKLETSKPVFGKMNFALNDFSVVKKDSSSMITIHTYIDGEFLNSYWADGIIVSTPTGSTGYSLSCGGPLIFPRSGNFVITPVSPHNLTVRPIVVSDSSEITFRVEGRSKKFLVSLDSRIASVDASIKLKVSKGNFSVNLIQLEGQHYFKTLRQKLNWGLDIRN
ncbi:NAD kinase [Pseudochryseolinea flava]|uniref:NAD kinase n=1 Tax=Pseudochryseolinea flava TaxID=2059302 RepID=A0A364Y7X1_9BACT|nr:NAD kinase [Pseudochryseolinea flava]RAW03087.1 NAD kinase [Pseudochryseolinea flava]